MLNGFVFSEFLQSQTKPFYTPARRSVKNQKDEEKGEHQAGRKGEGRRGNQLKEEVK